MTLTPETVVGMIVVFGLAQLAVLLGLKKLGIIKFANGDQCSDHKGFCNAFKKLKEEHIAMSGTIKQHEKQLDDGKAIFREIKADIAEINANVAVLLDRSEKKKEG